MLKYTQYGYVWPPRPETAIPSDMLGYYEKERWVAQIKKNGTCSLIFVSPEGEVIFKTRHNDDHKAWSPLPEHKEFFRSISGGQWAVFEAELLHNKGNTVKNTFYIFDIIVWQGDYLTGTTFAERQGLLQNIFKDDMQTGTVDHWNITDKIWLAKPITSNFLELYESLTHQEDEGLVLKNPEAKLKLCNKQNANGGWQVKCRRQHKNYSF